MILEDEERADAHDRARAEVEAAAHDQSVRRKYGIPAQSTLDAAAAAATDR